MKEGRFGGIYIFHFPHNLFKFSFLKPRGEGDSSLSDGM